MSIRKTALLLPAVLFAATAAATAGISPTIFHIEVSNAYGTDSFDVSSAQLVPAPGIGGWTWTLPMYEELASSMANPIATLNQASLSVVDNPAGMPRIILNFELRAAAYDITAVVDGPFVSFSPLPAAEAAARASAGFTLTDFADGVPAQLAGPGGAGMFTAYYNGATQFANMIPLLNTTDGGSQTLTDVQPPIPTIWQPLGVPLSDISVHYAFSLTARDLASGQNTYVVMPEPAALALAALAALALRRR